MASLNVESLRRKLVALQNTQDSIQTLSLWIIHHKNHYRQIVEEWIEACRNQPKINRRLTLLYLANDVIQNSKRKGATVFLDAFAEVLEDAATLCSDESIRKNVLRIFNIWEERNIYESDICEKLVAAAVAEKKETKAKPKPRAIASTKILAEYKPKEVPETIEELTRFEAETELKCKQLNNMNVDVTNAETIMKLKDRAGGKQFSKQFDEAATKLEDYVQSLTKEVEMRRKLVDLLDKGEIFYEAQNSEAKIVTNAYKNFGTRVNSLKKRLDEYKKLLPDPSSSPIPSPASDAPSPGATPPRDPNADTMEVEDMELSDEDSKLQGTIVAAAPVKTYQPPAVLSKQPMPALPTFPPTIPATTIPSTMIPPTTIPPATTAAQAVASYTPPGSPPSPEGSPIALSPPTPESLTPPEEKKKKKRSHSHKHHKEHKRDHHRHKRSKRKHSSTEHIYTPSPEAFFANHHSRTSTPSSKSDSKGDERVGTPVRDELDTSQNKEKLIREATTNPIEFLTKLINKSQASKGKKSAQSTSFINSLTVLSKNVKRLEAAKQAETNFELHKAMPLENTPTTKTATAVKTKSPVATTGPSVLPFSVSTVADSVEENKFKDHLAAHALSVGHIMKALKEGPPPPPPPPASSVVGFAPPTSAPVLYTPASNAPLNFNRLPVVSSASAGPYTPATSAPPPGGFPAPNSDIQIVGETPPEVQVIGVNPPPRMQTPSHMAGVPPLEQPHGAPHPVAPPPISVGITPVGVGPPPPQPVPPVSYPNTPVTPTHNQPPPHFSAQNEPYSKYNQGPTFPQPSPGPSPGPSPDQQRPPPFPDQPIQRPPPDQNTEPLFAHQQVQGPPPINQNMPLFQDPNIRGPSPNQEIRPPFSQQQPVSGPFPDIRGPPPNLEIRPPFTDHNIQGPPHGVRLPFTSAGPPPNQDIRPVFSGPQHDARPPYSEHHTGPPHHDQDMRVPFPHQENQGDEDMRQLFPHQDSNRPPQDQDMRPSFPPHQPPPEHHQGPPQAFDQDMRQQPYNHGDQDLRPPFPNQQDMDMRQPIHRQHSEGEQAADQPYDPEQPYDPGQSFDDQPYVDYSEQSYSEQPYDDHQAYSDQPYDPTYSEHDPAYSEHYPAQSSEGHQEHQQDNQHYDEHYGQQFHQVPPPDQYAQTAHERFAAPPPPQETFGGPQSQPPYSGPPPLHEQHGSEAAQPIQALGSVSRPRSILKKRKPENIVSLAQLEEEGLYEDKHAAPPETHNRGAPLPFHLLHAPPPPPEEPDHSWPHSKKQSGPPTPIPTVPHTKQKSQHPEPQAIKVVTSPASIRLQKPGPPPGPPPPSAKRLSGAPPPPPGPPPASARRVSDHGVRSSDMEMTDDELTELAHAELEQALEMSDSIPRIKPSKTLVQIPITLDPVEKKEPPPLKPALKSALKKDKPVSLPPILKSALKKIMKSESPELPPQVSEVKSDSKPEAAAETDVSKDEPSKSVQSPQQKEELKLKTSKDNVSAEKQASDKLSESPKGEPKSPIPVLSNKKKDAPKVKSQITTPPPSNERSGFPKHSDEIGAGEPGRPDYNRSKSHDGGPDSSQIQSIETVGQRRRSFPDRPFDRSRDRFEGRFDRNFGQGQFGRRDDGPSESFGRNEPMNRPMGMPDHRPDRFHNDRGMDQDYRRFDSHQGMGQEQFGRNPQKRPGPPMMGGPPSRRHPPPFYRY